MNKFLLAVFNTEASAEAGLQALHHLHRAGDITLYASGVVSRDAQGHLVVHKGLNTGTDGGKATGLAIGSLIGLLGGPVGMAIGAVTGTAAGALRDYWMAGVGIDFIEDAQRHLKPGKVALLAEIEEEWIVPVDVAIEAAGGQILRRGRTDVAEAQFEHDIAAFKAEIEELQAEASQARGTALARVRQRLEMAQAGLDGAVQRARAQVDTLRLEADARSASLKAQWEQTQGEVKVRIDHRMQRVKKAYHTRGAKLSRAWNLTKEALSA